MIDTFCTMVSNSSHSNLQFSWGWSYLNRHFHPKFCFYLKDVIWHRKNLPFPCRTVWSNNQIWKLIKCVTHMPVLLCCADSDTIILERDVISIYIQVCTISQPIRITLSFSLLWESQISCLWSRFKWLLAEPFIQWGLSTAVLWSKPILWAGPTWWEKHPTHPSVSAVTKYFRDL